MQRILNFTLLAGSVLAYSRQNRLVRVWDNIAIYDDQCALQGTFNMTSFPYIEGVSTLQILPDASIKPTRQSAALCATQIV